jgi:HAD superfamily phosphatase (TIGR01668 family)
MSGDSLSARRGRTNSLVAAVRRPLRLLVPDETWDSIDAIDYDRLRERGVEALLFDLDKTLGPRRPASLEPGVLRLLAHLRTMGFRVGILSNRRGAADPLIEALAARVPLVQRAQKPRRQGFRALLAQLDVPPQRAAMIGDRLLTDVVGANRMGMWSVRVRRHPGREFAPFR